MRNGKIQPNENLPITRAQKWPGSGLPHGVKKLLNYNIFNTEVLITDSDFVHIKSLIEQIRPTKKAFVA